MSDEKFLQEMKDYVLRIKRDIEANRNERHQVELQYKRDVSRLKQELVEIRKRCPHPSAEYHPDPSGNNDSWYKCHVCGAES